MKRVLSAAATLFLILSLAACGQSAGGQVSSNGSGVSSENEAVSSPEAMGPESSFPSAASETSSVPSTGNPEGKVLVAYFSWSGNTEEMASYIAEQTGGDLLEIQPETPYPTDYNECGEVALYRPPAQRLGRNLG